MASVLGGPASWPRSRRAALLFAKEAPYPPRPPPHFPPPRRYRPASPDTPAGPIQFHEVTERTGITFRHTDGSCGRHYIVEAMSTGLATFDYDGDGLVDIYFPNGAPLPGMQVDRPPRHALYRTWAAGSSRRSPTRPASCATRTDWASRSGTMTTTAFPTSI